MNVCLDARTATRHFPGIGRYVSNLARELALELESDSILRILEPVGTEAISDAVSGAAINRLPTFSSRVQTIPLRTSPFSLRQQWQLPRLLSRLGINLYHSPYYLMPYFIRVPSVLTVYDLIPLHFPRYVSPRARLLFRWTTRLALFSATRIIAISEATRQDYIRAFKLRQSNITVIHLASEPRFRPQTKAECQQIRQKYRLPERFALYLGSNKPHKNLVALVEAWGQAIESGEVQDGLLVVAGSWDDRYPLAKQRVESLGIQNQVRFLGEVPEADLPALYSAALFFVFPSLFEGFGLPLLEAMACGTPVACSDRSSLPEVAGEAALYFDPGNPLAISVAMRRLWYDKPLRQDLIVRGLEQAGRFSWQQTVHQTMAVYQQAMSKITF